MNKTIVASHNCVGSHYFVTWDFHALFELWETDPDNIGYQKCEIFTYPDPGLGMTYDDATIIGEDVFEKWLGSLDD